MRMKTRQYEVQKNGTYSLIVHRRLQKPPYPIRVYCPACGRTIIRRINADRIEIHNSPLMMSQDLTARDAWCELQHSCGTIVQLYWKD